MVRYNRSAKIKKLLSIGLLGFLSFFRVSEVRSQDHKPSVWIHQFSKSSAGSCELVFDRSSTPISPALQKPLTFLGYVSGVIPLSKIFQDPDKIFYVLLESPLTGLVTTPISVLVANQLTGNGLHLDADFLRNVWEVYWTYQVANVVRNGVSLDTSLSTNARSWLNWWFSASITALGTAGDHLANAVTDRAAEHAYSLIAYSMSFPLLSQQISQRFFVPLLFSKFPKKSLLDQIKDPSKTTPALVAHQEELIEETQRAIDQIRHVRPDGQDHDPELRKLEEVLLSARFSKGWIEWFRRGHVEGMPLSRNRELQYWGIKTGVSMSVAVFMVTLFYIGRWELVGRTEDDDGMMKRLIQIAMRDLSVEQAKEWGDSFIPQIVRDQDWDGAVQAVKALLKQYKDGNLWIQSAS